MAAAMNTTPPAVATGPPMFGVPHDRDLAPVAPQHHERGLGRDVVGPEVVTCGLEPPDDLPRRRKDVVLQALTVVRKLAVRLHRLWVTGEAYQPLSCDPPRTT